MNEWIIGWIIAVFGQTQPSTIQWIQSCGCCTDRMTASELVAGGPIPGPLPLAWDHCGDGTIDLIDFYYFQHDAPRPWPKMVNDADRYKAFYLNSVCYGPGR